MFAGLPVLFFGLDFILTEVIRGGPRHPVEPGTPRLYHLLRGANRVSDAFDAAKLQIELKCLALVRPLRGSSFSPLARHRPKSVGGCRRFDHGFTSTTPVAMGARGLESGLRPSLCVSR